MITEQDQEAQEIERAQNGIELCNQIIAKAEKYERLSDNSDWKGYLADLEIRAKIHDREIQGAIALLDEAPNNSHVVNGKVISSKMDWVDFIRNHKIRADVLREWIKEPEVIIKAAAESRRTLPFLTKKLAASKKETVGASGNGES